MTFVRHPITSMEWRTKEKHKIWSQKPKSLWLLSKLKKIQNSVFCQKPEMVQKNILQSTSVDEYNLLRSKRKGFIFTRQSPGTLSAFNRRSGCMLSSTCTAYTRGRDAPCRRPCDTSSCLHATYESDQLALFPTGAPRRKTASCT